MQRILECFLAFVLGTGFISALVALAKLRKAHKDFLERGGE